MSEQNGSFTLADTKTEKYTDMVTFDVDDHVTISAKNIGWNPIPQIHCVRCR